MRPGNTFILWSQGQRSRSWITMTLPAFALLWVLSSSSAVCYPVLILRPLLLANVNVLRYVCYMRSQFRLSSVCLSVVCLFSVTLVHPTQPVEIFGNFFRHTIAQGLSFSDAKNRWWGTPLSPWNLRSKWPTPYQTAKFRQLSAHSASTVIGSEKSSISTYRKSTTRFPTSHRWTVYVTPKSPKGWHKNAISLFVPVKLTSVEKSLLQSFFVWKLPAAKL